MKDGLGATTEYGGAIRENGDEFAIFEDTWEKETRLGEHARAKFEPRVLHNTLDVVKADQQRLSSKLDMVVQMLTETTKGMQALQGRIDSTEDKQWPPGGLAPSASELSVGKSHAAPSQAPTRLVPL